MQKLSLLFSLVVLSFVSCQSPKESAQEPDRWGGLTLYTVRNEMQAEPDSTLQEVADIGYKYIEEAAGYKDGKFFGMTPSQFDSKMKELGFKQVSSHQGGISLDNADQVIADVKAAGFEYLVVPIPPMGHFRYYPETQSMGMSDSVEVVTDILNTIGEKCSAAGLKMLYHNHDFEFVENANGIVPIDYFLENTDPEHVNFQLDLFWITKAGADPLEYFERYPGRFKMWHVKDMDDQGRFAPVGSGNIDFSEILAQKEKSGMKYYVVEQDMTFDGMKPLDAIRISYTGLEKFGFE